VASHAEVEAAVRGLADRLAGVDPDLRTRYVVDRTVSCRVTDLDVVYVGRLADEGLCDLHTEPAERAQVRLTVNSDDLLALADGRLALPTAWASGRLKVVASPLDLLKLRALL
jgi:SCP-2 sterol transfer family